MQKFLEDLIFLLFFALVQSIEIMLVFLGLRNLVLIRRTYRFKCITMVKIYSDISAQSPFISLRYILLSAITLILCCRSELMQNSFPASNKYFSRCCSGFFLLANNKLAQRISSLNGSHWTSIRSDGGRHLGKRSDFFCSIVNIVSILFSTLNGDKISSSFDRFISEHWGNKLSEVYHIDLC
jgi:hypothetical protein